MIVSEYIALYTDPQAQLVAVKEIIDALNSAVSTMVGGGNLSEYTLNDGQVNIKASYGSIKELTDAILFYKQEANRLLAQINGRVTRFVPCRNHKCRF